MQFKHLLGGLLLQEQKTTVKYCTVNYSTIYYYTVQYNLVKDSLFVSLCYFMVTPNLLLPLLPSGGEHSEGVCPATPTAGGGGQLRLA